MRRLDAVFVFVLGLVLVAVGYGAGLIALVLVPLGLVLVVLGAVRWYRAGGSLRVSRLVGGVFGVIFLLLGIGGVVSALFGIESARGRVFVGLFAAMLIATGFFLLIIRTRRPPVRPRPTDPSRKKSAAEVEVRSTMKPSLRSNGRTFFRRR